MNTKTINDPNAYKTCPFCNAEVGSADYQDYNDYTDEEVHNEFYTCPECGATAQITYVFADVTWTN